MIAGISRRWLENAFPANIPLVLLHPNFSNQHLLLEAAFNRAGQTPLYFSLSARSSNLETAWVALAQILKEQANIDLPALSANISIDRAAKTLLKAMQAVDKFTLIIDAFDFADEAIQNLVAAVASELDAKSQIVLSSRVLPIGLLGAPVLQGKLEVYPVDADRMLTDYLSVPSTGALLEVFGLGPGRAFINGKQIDRWDGMLPRSLFFYLIDKGMVTRDEIFSTFWPSLSVREATNVFHVTKRKISEILGFDLTTYWSGFYRVSPDVQLQYDVVKFIENGQNSAVADDADAAKMLERAIYLYRGMFLSTLEMDWASNRRMELEQVYAEALSTLARLRQRQGETTEALGLYLRAARTQPQREDLVRGIMSLFVELGQPQRAIEVYQHLATELKRSLSVDPDRQTLELADSIRKSQR